MRSSTDGTHPPLDSRNTSFSRGKRSHTPPISRRPIVTIMSTVLPTAWPSAEPPWISSIAMFVIVVFSLIGDEPELAARAGRVDVHAGMERDRHAELLARRPEVVVDVMVERQLVDVRRRPHEHAAQARRATACSTSAHARATSCSGTAATPNSRVGSCAQNVGEPVVVRALAVGDELDVVQRGDLVARTEEHREARVQHDRVDAVGVHVGEARLRVVAARPAQPFEQVVELARRHADRGGHLVVQLPPAAAHRAADVGRLVDLVFDDLVRHPVAPAVVVDPLGRPDVVRLFHDVAVAVDDLQLRHGGIFPRHAATAAR